MLNAPGAKTMYTTKQIHQGAALIKTLPGSKPMRISHMVSAETRNTIIDIAHSEDTTFRNVLDILLKKGLTQYQKEKRISRQLEIKKRINIDLEMERKNEW